MSNQSPISNIKLAALLLLTATVTVLLLAMAAGAQDKSTAPAIPREDMQACMACHSSEMEGRHAVNFEGLGKSPHKDLKCQDCHSSITSAPHTPEMLKVKTACGTCHTDANEAYLKSSHHNPDKVKGDHPTCITCHGNGDPHSISADRLWPRAKKAALCSNCHRQNVRMTKYGVDTDAVPSYEESFHGRALQRFGNLKVAICVDCHGHHDVLAPSNPAAPTNRLNAAKTCGRAGCHAGAKVNFAMSGANHLRLKMKTNPVLHVEELGFKVLTVVTLLGLLGGVALDLRREVMHQGPAPTAGRFITFLISLSFLFVVCSLGMSVFRIWGSEYSAITALALLLLAFLLYALKPKQKSHDGEPRYQRFSVPQRVQHGLLAVSFTLLVLTGMPLRFPQVEWLRHLNLLFGGLAVSRLIHRGAAVVMIGTWIWHTLFLLYRWHKAGYSFKSWSMWPSTKDVKDFVAVCKYYFGLTHEEPRYNRFQFREKFDYFAVYWGMPIMVFSGLVLWFPIYFGNRMPELGLSIAYIAHADEAVLAFLTIVLWHFYNTHFAPEHFPMSPVFYSGTLTRSEMEKEHPLELEQIEKSTGAPTSKPGNGSVSQRAQ